jgi:ubiquinone biosynthesis protein Coq4
MLKPKSSQTTKQAEKFKQTMSARKLMATVFWDRKGVPMGEFMQQWTTVTLEVYCETLKKNRVGPFKQKTRNADILYIHNAPP